LSPRRSQSSTDGGRKSSIFSFSNKFPFAIKNDFEVSDNYSNAALEVDSPRTVQRTVQV
jgi:hypothetical protein